MIAQKYISRVIAAIMALVVCLCVLAVAFSDQIAAAAETGVSMEYETALFNTDEIMSVNIIMDESDWEDMLKNAASEEYYQCNVEINGTMFYRVAIRPKGNTSLTSIANDPDTDRYSFKLEFDHYVEGQTCFGLDKLILNNNYADATNMKEALIYDMYRYLGADASLYNYAKISVNGEYWGVYLALEAVEDSFMLRNYGVQNGNLYKPESMDMGGGGNKQDGGFDPGNMPQNDGNFDFSDFRDKMPEGFTPEQNGDSAENNSDTSGDNDKSGGGKPDFPGGGGGFSMSGNGADLNYTDDDLDSYSTIWDGEITDSKKSDRQRVVTALKNISEGTDLESYMDIDNLLRYMAVHIFSVNDDSLSGNMAHNYYLYESGGKLNIIPWDYNLALGGMNGGSDASSVVNSAIDNAFSGTNFFDTLMEDETYHSQYYDYMRSLVEYISGGEFDAFYERVRSQIDELVQTDPTAFYSYDEYLTAVDTLYQVVKLRGESIQGQLDGTIPSTEEEQRSSDALIDASSLDLSVMGSMNTGGGAPGGAPGGRPDDNRNESDDSSNSSQPFGEAPAGFDPSQAAGNNQQASDQQQADTSGSEESAENQQNGRPEMGDFPGRQDNSAPQGTSGDNISTWIITLAVLAAAVIFAVLYRRKPRKRP